MKALKILLIIFSINFLLTPVFSKIYVNEISGNDKWLELYNSGDDEVDLGGYIVRKIDEEENEADWLIPAGTKIPAKGFIWRSRDKNNTDGSTFTWGISAKKDVAFKILDAQSNEIDYFEVRSDLYSDGLSRTVGRKTDGADELVIFKDGGTQGLSNDNGEIQISTAKPKKIFINEINGNRYKVSGEMQEKWLEIYNDEDESVDLSNYIVQKINEKGTLNNWFIPDGITIDAKGFLVYEQDSTNTDGTTFTWGISARKNMELRIFDTNQTLIDEFIVDGDPDEDGALYSEDEGRTVGREYDGAATLVVFPNDGTKGASNGKAPSSIAESTGRSELSVFVNNKTLHLSHDIENIVIYNVSGNKVLSQNIDSDRNMNLSSLSNGIYLVKIIGNNKERAQKILLKD